MTLLGQLSQHEIALYNTRHDTIRKALGVSDSTAYYSDRYYIAKLKEHIADRIEYSRIHNVYWMYSTKDYSAVCAALDALGIHWKDLGYRIADIDTRYVAGIRIQLQPI